MVWGFLLLLLSFGIFFGFFVCLHVLVVFSFWGFFSQYPYYQMLPYSNYCVFLK